MLGYKQTTHVPNEVFDNYLPILSGVELKILLIIIRQTYGWKEKESKERKRRDWISHSQFIKKCGVSRRSIARALSTLAKMKLITITNSEEELINSNIKRRGKTRLSYAFNLCQNGSEHVQFCPRTSAILADNKTNYTKLNYTKDNSYQPKDVSEIIKTNYSSYF